MGSSWELRGHGPVFLPPSPRLMVFTGNGDSVGIFDYLAFTPVGQLLCKEPSLEVYSRRF